MVIPLTPQLVFSHLEIALLAGLAALAVGMGLGYLAGMVLRAWARRSPRALSWWTLFPWRAVLAWLVFFLMTSSAVEMAFGLGSTSAFIATGAVLCLIAIPWSAAIFLRTAFPLVTWAQLVAMARTLVLISVVLLAVLHYGLGNYLDWARSTLNDQGLNPGYILLGALLFGLDLLFGAGQMLVAKAKPAR